MTVTVESLQKQLASLPLAPLDPVLRRKRDMVTARLLALAKEQGRVGQINLLAGRRD